MKIAVVGLGYVGLPLAVLLAARYDVTGFDIDESKLDELRQGFDRMNEVSEQDLKNVNIEYTSDFKKLAGAEVIVVAVPTPVDQSNTPDLTAVKAATKSVAEFMSEGVVVVYESTVYPGTTEDVCVPILEKESKLKYNKEFFVGYSPERVDPGNKERTIDKIVKVVSASNEATTEKLADMYKNIIPAGVHLAPSIRVAEAAKVIENVQRDVNIALINELNLLFDRLGIDTHAVIEAASTKWNFHRYTPGLVGGHCIGVDPYYLAYQANLVGYYPEIVHAARRINDGMHNFYANKLLTELNLKGIASKGAKVAVLGLTFKENCNDIRNSRARHLIAALKNFGCKVFGVDPHLDDAQIEHFGAEPAKLETITPDALIVAAPHDEFSTIDFKKYPIVIDIKHKFV